MGIRLWTCRYSGKESQRDPANCSCHSLANNLSGKTNPRWHLTHVGISPSALSTSPSRLGGQGTRHTGLLEKAGSLKTVQALHCNCGNSESERKGKNRAVAGGKGRNKQFYFKTGTLGWTSGSCLVVCVCCFLTVGMRTSHWTSIRLQFLQLQIWNCSSSQHSLRTLID